jgi:hypothetical protein
MKKILASLITMVLVVGITLAAIFLLVRATLYVTAIESPLERAGAIVAELLLGVVLLLSTVWVATHLAVRIFFTVDATASRATNALQGEDIDVRGGKLV